MLELYDQMSSSTTGTTGTTTGAGACARAREEEQEAMEMLADCYRDSLGRRAPGIVLEEMAALMDEGIQPCVIMMALDETAAAPRPSWAYCRAILRACLRDGATTAQGWRDRQARWAGQERRTASAYTQRDYSAEDRRRRFVDLERE